MPANTPEASQIDRLRKIMRALRDPANGCPWDRAQTFETIAPYTIEEAYEVADAISRGDWQDLRGELGDLLLQAVYHAQMAEEAGHFDFDDVVRTIADKMVDRHPHVFATGAGDRDAATQEAEWEAQKAAERAARARGGVLADVALALPALMRAQKLQKRAARVGFDWAEVDAVLAKLREEATELAAARDSADPEHVFEEFGDLLFVVVNLGRHLGIDAEAALRAANAKFTRRFEAVETALAAAGRTPETSDLAEMDRLWEAAKRAERDRMSQQGGTAGSPREAD